eukprot:4575014-Pyramimonas_sp.AAC.1
MFVPSWGPLRRSRSLRGAILITSDRRSERCLLRPQPGANIWFRGVHSGASGAVLEPSLAPAGALFERSAGASDAHRQQSSGENATIAFPQVLAGFGRFGGVLGWIQGHWEPIWGGIGASRRH